MNATTLYAAWRNISDNYLPLLDQPGKFTLGMVNLVVTGIIMISAVVIIFETGRRVYKVVAKGRYTVRGKAVLKSDPDFKPPIYGEA